MFLPLKYCYVLPILAALAILKVDSSTSKCEICKEIVSQFKLGLEKTTKSNFGGGNTKWEEKSLGRWRTSETRLVEIIEHHICKENSKDKCHLFLETNEESLEEWYFNKYAEEDSAVSLHDSWCVESTQVCCPEGRFGKDCSTCLVNFGQICSKHGKCNGDGTRGGDGKCKCDKGYSGELCDECEINYYEIIEEEQLQCLECHHSCDDSCVGPDPLNCDDCSSGWQWNETDGCTDINECLANHPCSEDQYCSNTEGSYHCLKCNAACSGCEGSGIQACKQCADGYEGEVSSTDKLKCKDKDECTEEPCTGSNRKCINTPGSFNCLCQTGFEDKDGECLEKVDSDSPTSAAQKDGKESEKDTYHEEL